MTLESLAVQIQEHDLISTNLFNIAVEAEYYQQYRQIQQPTFAAFAEYASYYCSTLQSDSETVSAALKSMYSAATRVRERLDEFITNADTYPHLTPEQWSPELILVGYTRYSRVTQNGGTDTSDSPSY